MLYFFIEALNGNFDSAIFPSDATAIPSVHNMVTVALTLASFVANASTVISYLVLQTFHSSRATCNNLRQTLLHGIVSVFYFSLHSYFFFFKSMYNATMLMIIGSLTFSCAITVTPVLATAEHRQSQGIDYIQTPYIYGEGHKVKELC